MPYFSPLPKISHPIAHLHELLNRQNRKSRLHRGCKTIKITIITRFRMENPLHKGKMFEQPRKFCR